MGLFDRFRKKEEEPAGVLLMQSIPMNREDVLHLLVVQRTMGFNLVQWQAEPKFAAYKPYMENMYLNCVHTIGFLAMAFAITKVELDEFEKRLTDAGQLNYAQIVPPDDMHGREVG